MAKHDERDGDSRGELASFAMQFDKTREASGINAGMTHVPEATEGSVPSPDNFDAARQDVAKEQGTPGAYNHPHLGGRGVW
jgi:hypothetical protein